MLLNSILKMYCFWQWKQHSATCHKFELLLLLWNLMVLLLFQKNGSKLNFIQNLNRWQIFYFFSSKMSTPDAQVPARVALGVTTLLAMSTTMASIQVNYDLWVKIHAFPPSSAPCHPWPTPRLWTSGLGSVSSLFSVHCWSTPLSTMLPGEDI